MSALPEIDGEKQYYVNNKEFISWWYCKYCDVVYHQPTTGYMYECGCGERVYPYYRQDLQVIKND